MHSHWIYRTDWVYELIDIWKRRGILYCIKDYAGFECLLYFSIINWKIVLVGPDNTPYEAGTIDKIVIMCKDDMHRTC